MNTVEFIREHFDSALAIHEASDKLGLSKDDARLMTYIHCQLEMHSGDYGFFEDVKSSTVEAIEFLLDKKELDPAQDERITLLNEIPKRLSNLDEYLRGQFGMEIRIQSELANRLLLHTNAKYRTKMLKLYREKIIPCLKYKAKTA